MVTTITEVLNIWNDMGVFSYVIPFLLIFAVVFAILKKTKILGEGNDGILAVISVTVGLLALQFDIVNEFYAIIFPRFGVGLSIFLVAIILFGFFFPSDNSEGGKIKGIATAIVVGVVLWSFDSWGEWSNFGFGSWLNEYFWSIIILLAIIGTIIGVTGSGKGDKG